MYVWQSVRYNIAGHDDDGGLQHGFIVHSAGEGDHHRAHLLGLPLYLTARLYDHPLLRYT